MKILKLMLVIAFVIVSNADIANAQEIAISIDSIVANSQITGRVNNLAPTEYNNYKVVVYVHTDQWYIHPYAGQDEGKSWAPIQTNGNMANRDSTT